MVNQLEELKKEIKMRDDEIQLKNEEIAFLMKRLFGTKSEKAKTLGIDQPSLFDEAEAIESLNEDEELQRNQYTRSKKKKGSIKDKMAKLPHQKYVLGVSQDQQVCPECHGKMKYMGLEHVRDELVFVPARAYVKEIYREVFECRACRKNGKAVIVKAATPESVIPHSYASAESVAHVMNMKYVQGVPLYRQEKEWKEIGFELNRATMANWMIQGAQNWLYPLIDHMHKELLKGKYIHADETPVQVLKEPNKDATSKSYMWLYSNNQEDEHPIRLYDYRPGRGAQHPQEYLKGFNGYLISDAYQAYETIEGVTNVFCWAHCRRKFSDALPTDRKAQKGTLAKEGINKIAKLFAIEQDIEEKSAEEKEKIRQERAKPLLDEFFLWCKENSDRALTGSKIYKAFQYALNNKQGLSEYIENGNLPMTNSLAERAIRPFTIGRKNWLFCDTVNGAKASAAIYSIVETAKANGLSPYQYLCLIFTQLPGSNYEKDTRVLEGLMPWGKMAQEKCKQNERGMKTDE